MKIKAMTVAAALAMTGCASITTGTTDDVLVQTSGCDEGKIECTLTNKDNNVHVRAGRTATLEKGKKNIIINCESRDGSAEGSAVMRSQYQAMNAGNILIGGGVGIIVDAATGAMWKWPATVTVPMDCEGE